MEPSGARAIPTGGAERNSHVLCWSLRPGFVGLISSRGAVLLPQTALPTPGRSLMRRSPFSGGAFGQTSFLMLPAWALKRAQGGRAEVFPICSVSCGPLQSIPEQRWLSKSILRGTDRERPRPKTATLAMG